MSRPLLYQPIRLRTALRTTLRLRCPACGEGRLFRGFTALHEHCAVCGVRFEGDSGNSLGPMSLAYFVVVAVVTPIGIRAFSTDRLGPGAEWCLSALAIGVLAASYRPVKAFWTWLMYLLGEVERDG